MTKPIGHFLHSGTLFYVAVSAYERLRNAPDKAGGRDDALVAILFSAATLEAYLPELTLVAESDVEFYKPLASVVAILDEAEASRVSIRLKYLLAKAVLVGETYDKGAPPYQDFDTLFAIRDAIIHMKPEEMTEQPHKLLQRLRAKDLCESGEPGRRESWVSLISTRAVARWACNTVVEMVESLKGCLPRGSAAAHSIIGRFQRVQ